MLKLITFASALGLRSPSPFAVKADLLLAMSGLPYERQFGDVRKAPKGKLPVLNDGGKLIPDSRHIQRYLETEKGADFDGHLSAEQMAVTMAFRRLIEEHLYFINVHFRWMEHAEVIKESFFAAAPALIRGLIFNSVQKTLKKTLELQGIGRFSREEIIEFGVEDIQAIAAQLGKSPYFMGKKISSIDASVYGVLHGLIDCDLDTPIKDECLKHDNLVDYCQRIAKEFPFR
ncbi:MAG: glutathione S-transferase family protein [Rhizobiaceae bacterium]